MYDIFKFHQQLKINRNKIPDVGIESRIRIAQRPKKKFKTPRTARPIKPRETPLLTQKAKHALMC